jgi:hypothetical protein
LVQEDFLSGSGKESLEGGGRDFYSKSDSKEVDGKEKQDTVGTKEKAGKEQAGEGKWERAGRKVEAAKVEEVKERIYRIEYEGKSVGKGRQEKKNRQEMKSKEGSAGRLGKISAYT